MLRDPAPATQTAKLRDPAGAPVLSQVNVVPPPYGCTSVHVPLGVSCRNSYCGDTQPAEDTVNVIGAPAGRGDPGLAVMVADELGVAASW